jgi:hypothetical protein
MLMIDLRYARALFNPYLLDDIHLHDDVDAKEVLNIFLWKTSTPIAYAQVLENFSTIVENRSFILHLAMKDLDWLPHEC